MSRLSPVAVASLVVLAVALPACVIRLGGPDSGVSFGNWHSCDMQTCVDGQDVRVEGGVLIVNGRELHHDRWVDVPLPAGCCDLLQLNTASGPVDVGGQPGDGSLRVRLWTEVEGDGTVSLQDGRLVASGQRGEALVNEITGSVPHGLSVRAASGTGAVSLCSLQKAGRIEVEAGIGDVRLVDCESGSIGVTSGTSDVLLMGGEAESVSLESGTGELQLSGGRFGHVQADTGTGDVTVEDCTVQRLQATSGTGDVVMHGGHVVELHHELGTGEIYIRGGARVGPED